VENTIHDDFVVGDLKKSPPIACSHPVFWLVVGQTFDIPSQVVFKEAKAFHNSPTILRRHSLEILLSFRFQSDVIFHEWLLLCCRTSAVTGTCPSARRMPAERSGASIRRDGG
jgi:hypothetical protein